MDPIDSVSRAMQLLRQRLAGRPRNSGAAGTPVAVDVDTPTAGPAKRLGPGTLSQLRALDPRDTRFRGRASELFVEDVLLAEFGTELTNDVEFRQVISAVARQMRDDPDTAIQLQALIDGVRSR